MVFWCIGMIKQYDVYLKWWEQFCQLKGINCLDVSVENGIDFFVILFIFGLGYSVINIV